MKRAKMLAAADHEAENQEEEWKEVQVFLSCERIRKHTTGTRKGEKFGNYPCGKRQ